MKKHWSARLKEWCDERRWKPADLIRESGVSRDLIYKYWPAPNKKPIDAPRGDTLDRLAKPFGKTGAELHYGPPPSLKATNEIPLLEANEIGTMTPLQEISDVWGGVRMTVVSANLAENTFSFIAPDDSCAPKIERGDVVICKKVGAATPGKFVVAVVEGLEDGILRKYRPKSAVDNSRFVLVSTNDDFPAIEVDDDHPGFVVGQVIKVIKDA